MFIQFLLKFFFLVFSPLVILDYLFLKTSAEILGQAEDNNDSINTLKQQKFAEKSWGFCLSQCVYIYLVSYWLQIKWQCCLSHIQACSSCQGIIRKCDDIWLSTPEMSKVPHFLCEEHGVISSFNLSCCDTCSSQSSIAKWTTPFKISSTNATWMSIKEINKQLLRSCRLKPNHGRSNRVRLFIFKISNFK